MKKRVIITGGPTNEPIDEVMKITNMSTGSFSVKTAEAFLNGGYEVCLILNKIVDAKSLSAFEETGQLIVKRTETTMDMMQSLEEEKNKPCHALIHASAVGDYAPEYSFLLEDLAEEIYKDIEKGNIKSADDVMKILMDKKRYMIDSSSKISSYQENLTVKLGLTPKIIKRLREWYPDTLLIGCKLLEDVKKDELYEVARELCRKNSMDFILGNDLADLRKGKPERYLVDNNGFTGNIFKTPYEVFDFIDKYERRK